MISLIIKLARKDCKTSVWVQQVFILSVFTYITYTNKPELKQFLPLYDKTCLIYFRPTALTLFRKDDRRDRTDCFPTNASAWQYTNLTVPSILWFTNRPPSFRTLTPTAVSFNFSIWSDMLVSLLNLISSFKNNSLF